MATGNPRNHHWCLLQLTIEENGEIAKHFPEVLFLDHSLETFYVELNVLLGKICYLHMKDAVDHVIKLKRLQLEDVKMIINLLKKRDFYAEAFGFGVLFALIIDDSGEHLKEMSELREVVAADLVKYEDNLKIFDPILKLMFKTKELKKPIFDYLDLWLEQLLFDEANIKANEKPFVLYIGQKLGKAFDLNLSVLRKSHKMEYYPGGKTAFIFKILHMSLQFMLNHRLKQARHLIAVAEELMKTVDQNTEIFKKLLEVFYMSKTIYLGKFLELCESYEDNLKKLPPTSATFRAEMKRVSLNDKVIDFGIPLPDGEDPELPVELELNEEKRLELYQKLLKYKDQLENSVIPKISEVYRHIINCKHNYDTNANIDQNIDPLKIETCKIQ